MEFASRRARIALLHQAVAAADIYEMGAVLTS
jgi:hypothetical protein